MILVIHFFSPCYALSPPFFTVSLVVPLPFLYILRNCSTPTSLMTTPCMPAMPTWQSGTHRQHRNMRKPSSVGAAFKFGNLCVGPACPSVCASHSTARLQLYLESWNDALSAQLCTKFSQGRFEIKKVPRAWRLVACMKYADSPYEVSTNLKGTDWLTVSWELLRGIPRRGRVMPFTITLFYISMAQAHIRFWFHTAAVSHNHKPTFSFYNKAYPISDYTT